MAEFVGTAAERGRPLWLHALYAVLLVSALSLVTLLVGEIYYAFEETGGHTTDHDHGALGSIFDLAWVVFLPTALTVFLGGVATLVGGLLRHSKAMFQYGLRALGYCALAVAIIAAFSQLEL